MIAVIERNGVITLLVIIQWLLMQKSKTNVYRYFKTFEDTLDVKIIDVEAPFAYSQIELYRNYNDDQG